MREVYLTEDPFYDLSQFTLNNIIDYFMTDVGSVDENPRVDVMQTETDLKQIIKEISIFQLDRS